MSAYPTIAIATIGIGSWYARGVARLIEGFQSASPGFEIRAWVNAYPPGAPGPVVRNGQDYGGYCAKPFALKSIKDSGINVGILLDASFFPIAHIEPLITEICTFGQYIAEDGFSAGQWMSDAALAGFELDREEVLKWQGCLSGCVGIDFRNPRGVQLIDQWAAAWPLFPGFHSNDMAGNKQFSYRNEGPVSRDPRVLGHRHDQTALAVIARRLGITSFSKSGITAHRYAAIEKTVLVCEGM